MMRNVNADASHTNSVASVTCSGAREVEAICSINEIEYFPVMTSMGRASKNEAPLLITDLRLESDLLRTMRQN